MSTEMQPSTAASDDRTRFVGQPHHGFTNAVVRAFLDSNLSIILILLAAVVGLAALGVTPREEDPQIVVPMADVHVAFPGHCAGEVEQLVTTPLEQILYQIDGVEHVYSMSGPDSAVVTVRFYVGQDRERSLVRLQKKIDENLDIIPPGVTGWIVKPIEIDDVPIVTLTLTSATAQPYLIRRVAEELVDRLATGPDISRAYVVGGEPRLVTLYLDPDRMLAHGVTALEIAGALETANVTRTAGDFPRLDQVVRVEVGRAFARTAALADLVIAAPRGQPVFLKDVASILDGPAETDSYVRHGWGPGRSWPSEPGAAGSLIGGASEISQTASTPAVTIAIAKKKGTNAVRVAQQVLFAAENLRRDVVPDDIEMVVTRNTGQTSNQEIDGLVESLGVALFFVFLILTATLGWRESLIVALAVPVVFGLTLAVNLMLGYTLNRVTIFALILALGLLVDDPIVDVENITRHFALARRASRRIVLDAVAEVRPPLITATIAVIVSFLPMSLITGMMGPYMRPMALNVPVAMVFSMVVAFTITPWLAYHGLKRRYNLAPRTDAAHGHGEEQDLEQLKQSRLYRLFYPLMSPLLKSPRTAWAFLITMGVLTVMAMVLAATRHVPLKMLPFGNKSAFSLVIDADEGTTVERTDAAVRKIEQYLQTVPEIVDYSSYVGLAGPIDFNGMVRHYYLRRGDHLAEIQINLVDRKSRSMQMHALSLRMRDEVQAIADACGVGVKFVEPPPGPPVIATLVAEVYGRADHTYPDLLDAARVVRARMQAEPGTVDLDDTIEADQTKLVFNVDKEKAALHGVSVEDLARTIRIALAGQAVGTLRVVSERQPLPIELRLPRPIRSSGASLTKLRVRGADGQLVPIGELGSWQHSRVDQTIYHKDLQRVVYVFGEPAGRAPADMVVDIQADRVDQPPDATNQDEIVPLATGWLGSGAPRPLEGRTFFSNGSGLPWHVPPGITVEFAGEGEWQTTLDVFRDLGLAFGAALIGIYIILVAQTKSFAIPLVVMLAIPLTVLGIMPGFWLLNALAAGQVGPYADPIFFTATGMIGMIALAGIVTRDSIILVDFIHLSLARGRSLFDAIMESRVVRLRPILLTAGVAMLSALPIASDPVFSGLAWSLVFGLFASTLFTLFVIPVTYWLLYEKVPGHGLPVSNN